MHWTLRKKLLLPALLGLLAITMVSIGGTYFLVRHAIEHMALSQLPQTETAFAVARRIGLLLALIALPVAGAAALLMVLMMQSALTPLRKVIYAAEQLATGNLNLEIPAAPPDEIGQLGQVVRTLQGYMKNITAVVEQVANLEIDSTITPQSPHDQLNQALQQMLLTLRTLMTEMNRSISETEQQNWLKDGLNQLSAALLGELSVQEICVQTISFLARYLGAGHGVIYTNAIEQQVLMLGGAFALTEHDQQKPVVHFGEGVIGQVARDRMPIMLNNLQRATQLIVTGTVSEPPLTAYVMPLLYNEELYGVLELSTSEEMTPARQNFLKNATPIVATALFSAMQRERVQALLQQSQQAAQQAEAAIRDAQQSRQDALAQAEALQQANAQLEEQQQQLLQQSEEFRQISQHLEAQQHELQQQRELVQQREEALQAAQRALAQRPHEAEQAAVPSTPSSVDVVALASVSSPRNRPAMPDFESGVGPHILLVEDHQAQREALADFLRTQAQMQVTEAASVEEARNAIDTGRYTAAVLDLGLQDGSGYDLCTYIKAHHLDLPVIIYTARDLSEQDVRHLQTYAESIIIKTARSSERLLDELALIVQRQTANAHMPHVPTITRESATIGVNLNGKKVLLADTDVKHAFILASFLEDTGMIVYEAANGTAALDLLHTESDIAFLLLDVRLPGMEGFATLRDLRNDPRWKELPVFALIPPDAKEQRQPCIQAGANDYLLKPVEQEALLRAITAWVEQRTGQS